MIVVNVRGEDICVPEEPALEYDDFASGSDVYTATGYAKSDSDTSRTWKFFWRGDGGGLQRIPPGPGATPFKAVNLMTREVIMID